MPKNNNAKFCHKFSKPAKNPKIRITSGQYRGQTIESPHDSAVHPMGSREKLALFNLLQPYLSTETKLLDAYAGNGALGIEALSRGVKNITFIEKSPKVATLISQNLQKLKINSHNIRILNMPVEKAAETLPKASFDIIIADPPYHNFEPCIVETLAELLSNGGILALSSPKTAEIPPLASLKPLKVRNYAAAQISIYQKTEVAMSDIDTKAC